MQICGEGFGPAPPIIIALGHRNSSFRLRLRHVPSNPEMLTAKFWAGSYLIFQYKSTEQGMQSSKTV